MPPGLDREQDESPASDKPTSKHFKEEVKEQEEEKDKDANSRSTPDLKKSPFYGAAVIAASQGGDIENTIFLSGGRSGGQTLRTLTQFVEERALNQKESWYFIRSPGSKGRSKDKDEGKNKDKDKGKDMTKAGR